MGEIVEAIIEGSLCAGCGVFLDGNEPGFARYCYGCRQQAPASDSLPGRFKSFKQFNKAMKRAANSPSVLAGKRSALKQDSIRLKKQRMRLRKKLKDTPTIPIWEGRIG